MAPTNLPGDKVGAHMSNGGGRSATGGDAAIDQSTASGKAANRTALIINGESLAPEVLADDGIDVAIRRIDELAVAITPTGVRVTETVLGRDLAEFGLVQLAGYGRPTALLINAISAYLRGHGVPVVNMAGIAAPTKLVHYVQLAQAGVPVPTTLYLPPGLLVDSYRSIREQLDLPFMLKGLGGRRNCLVRNESEFRTCIDSARDSGVSLLAQEFVANQTAYCLMVLGDDVPLAMRRTWEPAANIGRPRHAASKLVRADDLGPAVRSLARQAADVTGYEVARVELIKSWATGRWFVLDVNGNLAMMRGAFGDENLAAYRAYLQKRLGVA